MSITQIAEAANVSYATAWRIINNRPCSSERAVSAVRAAMRRMNYSPAEVRRGRRRKHEDGIRTHNIALLHLRPGTSISSSVLSAVHELLAERNLNLIFADFERSEMMPQALRAGNVDGILGYGEFPTELITPAVRKIPSVWMMTRSTSGTSDLWGDRVRPDHYAIGTHAAEHLLSRGHRHFAYFNPQPGLGVYQERGGAFRSTLEGRAESFHVLDARDIRHGLSAAAMEEAADQFFEQWAQLSPRPTGIFVPVDRVTLRVYQQFTKHGIDFGREIEVVSCDNEPDLLPLMNPTPASIDINRAAIARLAVERLLWRMKNGTSFPSIVITVSPTLVAPPTLQRHDADGDE